MTDDSWRKGRYDDDEDFGPPLFGDEPTDQVQALDLSFGEGAEPMPHWTDPPTGEVPRALGGSNAAPDDSVDVWASFTGQQPAQPGSGGPNTGQQPVWRGDRKDRTDEQLRPDDFDDFEPIVDTGRHEHDDDPFFPDRDPSEPSRREPGRITIGTDPTEPGSRPVPRKGRSADRTVRPGTPPRGGAATAAAGVGGRNMPVAVAVGAAIAAVFVLALATKPYAVLAIIVAIVGLAAVEFYDKVTEKGYRPASVVGIVAAVALPFAVYYAGVAAFPVAIFLAVTAVAVSFIGATSLDSEPLPNAAITLLGVLWIAVLGSFAVAILNWSNVLVPTADGVSTHVGTDTLFMLALAVVANDVGALFVGSVAGRTPLRAWISPNKSVEGLVGGTLATLLAMVLVHLTGTSTTWNSLGDVLLLGLVVSLFAPIGDLTESMFKRSLGVKDFGTIVPGHGGILDRFDGFLFVLPAVYYLTLVLEPFLTK
jgi:phosphatidate cytidylyltransferase